MGSAQQIKLGEVAEIQIGYLLRGKLVDDFQGRFRVIQMRNARSSGLLDLADCPRLTLPGKVDKYLVRKGDAIFLARGLLPMAYLVGNEREPCLVSNHFYILRPNRSRLLGEYLVWLINQAEAQTFLQSRSEGTAARLVRKASLQELMIELPPLAIQKRIVRLQQLLTREKALCASLLATREKLIDKVCQELVQGDLGTPPCSEA
jgi:hypothetical protein